MINNDTMDEANDQPLKLPRFIVRISVRDWRHIKDLTAGEVSRNGLFVRSARSVDIGVRVVVELHLPDEQVLRLGAEVVPTWSIERSPELLELEGFGIKFEGKHASDLALLEAVADSNCDLAQRDEAFITLPVLLISTADGGHQMTSAHRTAFRQPDAERKLPNAVSMVDDSKGAVELLRPPSLDDPRGVADDLELPRPGMTDGGSRTSEFEVVVDEEGALTTPAASSAPGADTRQVSRVSERCIFGIDFGSSYSRIAAFSGGRAMVLADDEGQSLVPSVVHYPKAGDPVVGWPARLKLATEPMSTVMAPKRLLGFRHDDAAVQALLGQMRVPTEAGPSRRIVATIRGQTVAIPQVVADILRHLGRIGEQATGVPVKRVVLGAPVTFNEEQRAALKRAGQLAGLEVVALVHEPFAAMLAYGTESTAANGTIAVYDFGGGTFDFTLARIVDGRFAVIGQSGDPWLGGQDFDLALANHAADVFEKERKLDLRKRQVEWQQLLLLCESVKHRLSSDEQADLLARGMMRSIRGPVDLHVRYDRALLARLCFGLIHRSLEVANDCLRAAGLKPADLDQVVMTGGVSRIPLVREQVQGYFRRPLRVTVSPEQAIVMGNTLYGAMLDGAKIQGMLTQAR